MGMIILYSFLFLLLFSFAITLRNFQKEMKKKMQYQDFVADAKDGIYNDFRSNYKYAHASTKGIAVYKSDNGKYFLQSQSKLFDTSIEY